MKRDKVIAKPKVSPLIRKGMFKNLRRYRSKVPESPDECLKTTKGLTSQLRH